LYKCDLSLIALEIHGDGVCIGRSRQPGAPCCRPLAVVQHPSKEKDMNHKRAVCGGVLIGALVYLLVAFPAAGGAPAEQIQQTTSKVLAILRDPALKGDANKKERLERLKEVIEPQFDFAEMAKRALGPHWQRRTAEEQREFQTVFTDLLESSYTESIESYSGEKVAITSEKQEKEYAEVGSKIISAKGEEFSIHYRLHATGGNWKIYDVVIENISIVNNFRSQFNRVIAQSSYQDLLQRMKAKQFAAPGKRAAKN
jgi:phospholipid transport system substrate-binding protein